MKISIAGLIVEIKNRYDHISVLAKDYLTESDHTDISVEAIDEELAEEAESSEFPHSKGYLESIVVYRKIAEQLPSFDAFVFHGAVMALGGEAYAVTARSGVGKTTHVGIWQRVFGDKVHVLNGDKPIIRFIDGIPYACGTPWRGKENFGAPEMLPLRAIGFLERSETPSAELCSVDDAQMRLVSQMYIPKNPVNALRALGLADRTLRSVRLAKLFADMSDSAAEVAYRIFTEKG